MTVFQGSFAQLLTTDELADRPATSPPRCRSSRRRARPVPPKGGRPVCFGAGGMKARLDHQGRPTDQARRRRLH